MMDCQKSTYFLFTPACLYILCYKLVFLLDELARCI